VHTYIWPAFANYFRRSGGIAQQVQVGELVVGDIIQVSGINFDLQSSLPFFGKGVEATVWRLLLYGRVPDFQMVCYAHDSTNFVFI
jgi:hypothetical protein